MAKPPAGRQKLSHQLAHGRHQPQWPSIAHWHLLDQIGRLYIAVDATSNRVDLFFSPISEVNKWGWMAPYYDDKLGYEGSVGIREGTNRLNIITGVIGGQ